jgi:hypothetical protein
VRLDASYHDDMQGNNRFSSLNTTSVIVKVRADRVAPPEGPFVTLSGISMTELRSKLNLKYVIYFLTMYRECT